MKTPAAAGATVAALGVAAAVSIGVAGSDENPREARMAAHQSTPSDKAGESDSAGKEDKPGGKHRKREAKKPVKKDDKSRATATVKAAKKTAKPTEPCSTDLDGTVAPVAQVGNHVLSKFDVDSAGGRAGRAGSSDHPSGLAIDFMVDPQAGNEVADYVLQHQQQFGVTYVIWQQRYNDGSGWSTMQDRGSPTANHMDHVHVSFSG
ncbi:MAG: hypothetical protein ACRDQB_14410, partial [Thermocrispum sp.]